MNFEELKARWPWRAIHNCPGRFILSAGDKNISPEDLAGAGIRFSEFQVEKARDTVVVGPFDGGGLISYRKEDGSFRHTLNTAAGFERKLRQLGIKL